MRNDRHIAIKLRKKGLAYNKISKELGIPKSTMCYWFKNEPWSQKIKKDLTRRALYIAKKRLRLINKARREKWEKWREGFRQEAHREFPVLFKNPLFLTGINLYWGEGDARLRNGKVSLVNTDPKMISLFVEFLIEIAKVPKEKIFAWMTLYPDLSEKVCKSFWSRNSRIPSEQFKKTQFINGRHPTRRVRHGMCAVIVFSRGLKEKIFTWIDLIHREIMRE